MVKTMDHSLWDNLRGNWNYPTSMRFGVGRIAELAEVCQLLRITKPLLVTDAGLVKLPFVREIIETAHAAGLPIKIFSDVKPNPTGKNVDEGVNAFQQGQHDGVVRSEERRVGKEWAAIFRSRWAPEY